MRDAATVVLVRDAAEGSAPAGGSLEVFVLRRHPGIVFGGGAHVFPGGAVDPADRSVDAYRRVVGLDDPAASSLLGLRAGGLGFWVAAVREAFEEGGILLTRGPAGERPDPHRHQALRDALNRRLATGVDVLRETGRLHTADLLLLAHFVTPPGAPRRYDTWFFVAAAPPGQDGAPDDDETVAAEWVRPADLLARARSGEVTLFGPTPQVIALLARYRSAADLLGAVAAAQAASGGRPGVARDGWGERIVLPGEPGFGRTTRGWSQPLVSPARPVRFDASAASAAEEGVA